MPAVGRTTKTKDPTAGGSGDKGKGKGKDTAGEKGSDKVRAQKEKAALKAEQKKRDREKKRDEGKLSCAECRRLKLKCDRQRPCGSCQRRGCEYVRGSMSPVLLFCSCTHLWPISVFLARHALTVRLFCVCLPPQMRTKW